MKKLLQGIQRFQRELSDEQRLMFQDLVKGQQPENLFISCSDSRVMPSLFTQAKPGTLFEIQNAGNLVPAYGAADGCGFAATVEYAVDVLGVSHVVVCGHSHCGAMTALFEKDKLKDTPAIASWLGQAERARRVVLRRMACVANGSPPSAEVVEAAVEANVVAQLDNLRTHPSVAVALEAGLLQLHGWVYDFEHGEVLAYDPETKAFATLKTSSQTD